jgi:hypothetical protein
MEKLLWVVCYKKAESHLAQRLWLLKKLLSVVPDMSFSTLSLVFSVCSRQS